MFADQDISLEVIVFSVVSREVGHSQFVAEQYTSRLDTFECCNCKIFKSDSVIIGEIQPLELARFIFVTHVEMHGNIIDLTVNESEDCSYRYSLWIWQLVDTLYESGHRCDVSYWLEGLDFS